MIEFPAKQAKDAKREGARSGREECWLRPQLNGTANVWPSYPTARIANECTNIKLMATGYAGPPGKSS